LRGLQVILQILRFGGHFCGEHGASAPPPSAKLRRDLYISNFMSEFKPKGPIPKIRVVRAYLGEDGCTGQTLIVRGYKELGKIIITYLTAVHEPP